MDVPALGGYSLTRTLMSMSLFFSFFSSLIRSRVLSRIFSPPTTEKK